MHLHKFRADHSSKFKKFLNSPTGKAFRACLESKNPIREGIGDLNDTQIREHSDLKLAGYREYVRILEHIVMMGQPLPAADSNPGRGYQQQSGSMIDTPPIKTESTNEENGPTN